MREGEMEGEEGRREGGRGTKGWAGEEEEGRSKGSGREEGGRRKDGGRRREGGGMEEGRQEG